MWRKTIWPLMKLAVMVAVVGFVLSAAIAKIARPFRLLSFESSEARRTSQQVAQLRSENDQIERRIKYLKTPRGAADAARKLGYVNPGEIMFVVPNKQTP